MPIDGPDGETMVRPKRHPIRADGQRTRDAILDATGALLNEVGFEGLSTNLICAQAGLTAPALYRYYPNKYAVLFDIAHELLNQQHGALRLWLEQDGFRWDTPAQGLVRLDRLQAMLGAVADRQIGAIWIMRAMRSIPKLRELWLVARGMMTNDLLDALKSCIPALSAERLAIPARLLDEVIDLSTHLALDHPEFDRGQLAHDVSLALVSYIAALKRGG